MLNANDVTATPNDVALTPRERLARARAENAKREERAAAQREEAEIERLDLITKYERELGQLGRAWTLVDVSDLGEGFIVLKLGEGVLWKSFIASKMDAVDTESFVLPNVVQPSKDDYRAIVARRGFVADRCAVALSELYGVKRKDDQGK